jgi:hypothetical protein
LGDLTVFLYQRQRDCCIGRAALTLSSLIVLLGAARVTAIQQNREPRA